VVGDMQGGLIELIAKNVIPMGANHWQTYTILVILGIAFSAIYFFIFRFLILKFDFKTPGRGENEEEVELYTKKDYKDKKNKTSSEGNAYRDQASVFLEALGGSENIVAISNCATRLRVTVADETKVKSDEVFLKGKAHGVVRKGKAFQVI